MCREVILRGYDRWVKLVMVFGVGIKEMKNELSVVHMDGK